MNASSKQIPVCWLYNLVLQKYRQYMAGLLAPPYGVMETGSNNDSKWSVSILHLRICFVVCVFMWQKKGVCCTPAWQRRYPDSAVCPRLAAHTAEPAPVVCALSCGVFIAESGRLWCRLGPPYWTSACLEHSVPFSERDSQAMLVSATWGPQEHHICSL